MKRTKSILTTAALGAVAIGGILAVAAPASASPSSPFASASTIAFANDTGASNRTLLGTGSASMLSPVKASPVSDSFGARVSVPDAGTSGPVSANGQCVTVLWADSPAWMQPCTGAANQRFTAHSSTHGVLLEQDGLYLSASTKASTRTMSLQPLDPSSQASLQHVVPNK